MTTIPHPALSLAAAASMFALIPAAATAAPCASAAYSAYAAAGFSCEIGASTFENFSFFLQNGGADNVLGTDDIMVTPLIGPDFIGLRLSGDFTATGGADDDGPAAGIRINAYRFFFDVTRIGGVFTDVAVGLNGASRFAPNPAKFGGILGTNQAANDGASAIANDTVPMLFDQTALNADRMTINSDNLLQLAGGASAAGTALPVGFASLDSIDFRYVFQDTPIPAPAPLALFGLGILGLAIRRRKTAVLQART